MTYNKLSNDNNFIKKDNDSQSLVSVKVTRRISEKIIKIATVLEQIHDIEDWKLMSKSRILKILNRIRYAKQSMPTSITRLEKYFLADAFILVERV